MVAATRIADPRSPMLAAQSNPADAAFRQVLDAQLPTPGPDHPQTPVTRGWLDLLQRLS